MNLYYTSRTLVQLSTSYQRSFFLHLSFTSLLLSSVPASVIHSSFLSYFLPSNRPFLPFCHHLLLSFILRLSLLSIISCFNPLVLSRRLPFLLIFILFPFLPSFLFVFPLPSRYRSLHLSVSEHCSRGELSISRALQRMSCH
jgi:hypothetical protein